MSGVLSITNRGKLLRLVLSRNEPQDAKVLYLWDSRRFSITDTGRSLLLYSEEWTE